MVEGARAKNDIKIKKHVYPALESKRFRSSDEKYGIFSNIDVMVVTSANYIDNFFVRGYYSSIEPVY